MFAKKGLYQIITSFCLQGMGNVYNNANDINSKTVKQPGRLWVALLCN